MENVARELVRAVRGHRSQRQLSMRLGYKSNPVGEWEAGRRWPTAAEFLRMCRLCGIDLPDAATRFHVNAAPMLGRADDQGVADWLTAIRGQRSVSEIARWLELSRSAVSRWMSGAARPRLPVFLGLVDACTGRLADWVAALVPIERVPSVAEDHHRARLARRLLFDQPWAIAVWASLQTSRFADRPVSPAAVGRALGIPTETAERCIEALVEAGVLTRRGRRFLPGPSRLVVDTKAVPGGADALKRHWGMVAMERLPIRRPDDQYGYAVFGVSQDDLARLRELHRAYYRQVRAIVADSEPTERVALLCLQLVELDAPLDAPPE